MTTPHISAKKTSTAQKGSSSKKSPHKKIVIKTGKSEKKTVTTKKNTDFPPTQGPMSRGLDIEPTTGKLVCTIGSSMLAHPSLDTVVDLGQSRYYLNRELTWLNFNRRVLYEAENKRNPLLERIKFLAIVSSNLDEFFMKRIGGLKQLIGVRLQKLSVDGRTPLQQLHDCYKALREIDNAKGVLYPQLVQELKEHDVHLLSWDELDSKEQLFCRDFFIHNIYPLVTPQGIDSAHPFPFISNLSLNLLVSVKHASHEAFSWGRVKVPIGPDIPRFLRLHDSYRFIRAEELFQRNIEMLFPSVSIIASELFRVTRNANTEKDEEKADDLLELIESELRDRKFAPIVRLQVVAGMNPIFRRMLCQELGLDEQEDVFETDGMLGMKDLFEIAALPIMSMKFAPHHPVDHPRILKESGSIFENLRNDGPILLFHPYESFTNSVERFLREASEDSNVRAIKMTLYRTSAESKVIEYLINAAHNGKQVAVVVELKAKFDEAANIRWATQLEEIGIHATYGVIGYKTHSKTILVIRKDSDGLRRYSHIGTGNYHSGTARLYTDLGMLTCDPDIGNDLTELFNFLTTGYTPQRQYRKMLMAPSDLKRQLIAKIQREVSLHTREMPGLIQFKMNALEDGDITRNLYEASKAGVKIDLIVRDTCRIRPGIPGLSDNIRVISIIGRFLEHSRIFYFKNGGKHEYYIGSADAMQRNLEKRVEAVVPVESEELQGELRKILDVQLQNTQHAWSMRSDGSYERLHPDVCETSLNCQEMMIELAEKRKKTSVKLKKMHSHGKSKKEFWAGH